MLGVFTSWPVILIDGTRLKAQMSHEVNKQVDGMHTNTHLGSDERYTSKIANVTLYFSVCLLELTTRTTQPSRETRTPFLSKQKLYFPHAYSHFKTVST